MNYPFFGDVEGQVPVHIISKDHYPPLRPVFLCHAIQCDRLHRRLGPSSQYAVCAHRGLRSQLISSYDIPGSHVDNQQHEIVEAASLVPDHQALRIHKAILPVSARHMILSGTFAQQS